MQLINSPEPSLLSASKPASILNLLFCLPFSSKTGFPFSSVTLDAATVSMIERGIIAVDKSSTVTLSIGSASHLCIAPVAYFNSVSSPVNDVLSILLLSLMTAGVFILLSGFSTLTFLIITCYYSLTWTIITTLHV